MKYIVWKAYWNFEKEEKYLNEMSSKGLALTDYSWCRYVFEEAPRKEWVYRIELLENYPTHPESQNYIRFMEETGAEFVASYMRWVFFRRKSSEGEYNIYSDVESKIKHYTRVRALFLFVAAINLISVFINAAAALFNYHYTHANIYLGLISLTIVAVFGFTLLLPLTLRINALKKERNISE
jgi:hypothetical protein